MQTYELASRNAQDYKLSEQKEIRRPISLASRNAQFYGPKFY